MRYAEHELQGVREDLVKMCTLAEEALERAIRGLLTRDVALAEDVMRGDVGVNHAELAVDDRCLEMLARYQPEAGDLRFLAMALKITNDLERIGDQAVNIAERAVELLKEPSLDPFPEIAEEVALAQAMLRDSVQAFVRGDPALARTVCERDDAVDGLDDRIVRGLLDMMRHNHRTISRGVQWVLVSRHLERVADHATNVAEDVIYLIEGRQIKHHHDAREQIAPESAR